MTSDSVITCINRNTISCRHYFCVYSLTISAFWECLIVIQHENYWQFVPLFIVCSFFFFLCTVFKKPESNFCRFFMSVCFGDVFLSRTLYSWTSTLNILKNLMFLMQARASQSILSLFFFFLLIFVCCVIAVQASLSTQFSTFPKNLIQQP